MAMKAGTKFESGGGVPSTELVALIDEKFRARFGDGYQPDQNTLDGMIALAEAIVEHIAANGRAVVTTSDSSLQRYDPTGVSVSNTDAPTSTRKIGLE